MKHPHSDRTRAKPINSRSLVQGTLYVTLGNCQSLLTRRPIGCLVYLLTCHVKMVEGSIMSRQEFNDYVVSKMHYGKADRERWTKDTRGDHTLQISLACGIHLRCLWLNINDDSMQYFRSMNPRETAGCAQVWEQELMVKIASGKP